MADLDDVSITKTLCGWLGGIPGWEWRETGPAYDGETVAIFYGAIDESAGRAVGVRIYGGGDDPIEGLSWRRVQLRFRGAPKDRAGADALASAALTRLQTLSRMGGISRASRLSFAPAGVDGNGRAERTDNYTLTLDNPEA